MQTSYKIQSIIFPTEEKHRGCRKLFYRGSRGILDVNKKHLSLGYGQSCDFVTYINACSYQKWKTYTNASNLTLHLTVKGDVEIIFLGYSKDALTVNRKEYDTKKYLSKSKHEIVFSFPENDEMMVGFEISALSNCTIYGGYYTVDVDKSSINNVTLSIATTTCKKEDFIKKNVEIIKQEILNTNEEIANNIYLHVVDNGQTLTKKDIQGKHIYLHPNINAGGSGGFARGMIESLAQKPKVTNVLLMDDDVLILSESIKRTYNLLKLLKPEYKDNIISGAMLYYENPKFQHEDIGTINAGRNNNFRQLKPVLDHSVLEDNLENEKNYILHKNAYSGWWYCCIPTTVINRVGLPLPVFIRCDDMEYGIRAKVPFITMNGICIWHLGFATKYNAAFDKYQQHRNIMIAQSTSDIIQEINTFGIVYDSFRSELMRFNYDAAQLVLEALEDYMKGPTFIKTVNGEKLIQRLFKLNDNLVPLSKLPDSNTFRIQEVYDNPPLSFKNRLLLKLTWNGQRFFPKRLEKPEVAPIVFDSTLQPEKIALHSTLLAVNPYNGTGTYRIKDKKRFKELMKRYKKAAKNYKKNKEAIAKQYSDARKEITSETFWRKYLGI